eukprot:253368-Amphidinium_carterae.3
MACRQAAAMQWIFCTPIFSRPCKAQSGGYKVRRQHGACCQRTALCGESLPGLPESSPQPHAG